jgi:hypothetical protein
VFVGHFFVLAKREREGKGCQVNKKGERMREGKGCQVNKKGERMRDEMR